jgi:hypothetical protein
LIAKKQYAKIVRLEWWNKIRAMIAAVFTLQLLSAQSALPNFLFFSFLEKFFIFSNLPDFLILFDSC